MFSSAITDASQARSLLAGRCRGVALSRWAASCRTHFGELALARVRTRVAAQGWAVPDEPSHDAWFPVGVQLALTDAILDECLDGDAAALEPIVVADVRATLPKAAALLLRAAGPGSVLARAPRIHAHVYDVGRADAEVRRRAATVCYRGAALFVQPTWRVLQRCAMRGLVQVCGRSVVALDEVDLGDDGWRVELTWR